MDKSKLLTDRVTLNTDTVEIEGVGTITVRGLSRFELHLSSKKYPGDDIKQEQFVVSAAVLDPKLTEDDVATWQKMSGPDEINRVAKRINELSGIGKAAAKSGVPGDGDD